MKNKKGFTLIEIMVTLTILVLLLGVVAASTILTQQFSTGEHSRTELQNDIRIALAYIETDVRSSNQIVVSDGDCFIIIGTVNTRYCLVGTQIQRNDQPVSSKVSSFSYTINVATSTLVVNLTSLNDRYGRPIITSETYYLRDGRSN
jgi:prepilin-type N-terminal cleavage/methylation domain-containing protein